MIYVVDDIKQCHITEKVKWGLRERETAERDTDHVLKLLSPHVAFSTSVCRSLACMSNTWQTNTTVLLLSLLLSLCRLPLLIFYDYIFTHKFIFTQRLITQLSYRRLRKRVEVSGTDR